MKHVKERLEKVQKHRLKSTRDNTKNRLALTPYLFGEIRQPKNKYILIPKSTTQRRKYVPITIQDPNFIAGDSCIIINTEDLYIFGILTSTMHMDWLRYTGGRIKGDFRYSIQLVYNTFPLPINPPQNRINNIRKLSNSLLLERRKYPNSTLADLYNPLATPKSLIDLHQQIDREVEKCYRPEVFNSESERIHFLLKLYQTLT